jgi:hypothetical protein
LQAADPQSFDIEGVEEGQEGGYVEMVGALTVYMKTSSYDVS